MPEIEVQVVPTDGDVGDLSARTFLSEKFERRVGELGESLAQIAVKIREQLDGLMVAKPTGSKWALREIELKFSLDLKAETGVIIARGEIGSGFEATLTWKAPGGA